MLMRNHRMSGDGRVLLRAPAVLGRVDELRSFVLYCASRIERDLGDLERWTVMLMPRARLGFMGVVIVEHAGDRIEARSPGRDALLAVWNAMCRVEQPLRDAVPRRRVVRGVHFASA